jgi:hypothetical protein
VHPEQPALEPEIEEIWLAACADAGLDPADCLLYVLDGTQSQTGYSGMHFQRVLRVYESEQFGDDINAMLDELNADERIDATRILVWRDRTIEGLAALIRHELEHAVQNDANGLRVEGLYHLAMRVLAVRVGGLNGGGLLYTTIPNELDANAAAAMFVRARYGDVRINQLLDARDEDSALFRSLVGPGPLESLPERLFGFFIGHRDLCERFAADAGFPFRQLLNLEWNGAGTLWQDTVAADALTLPH